MGVMTIHDLIQGVDATAQLYGDCAAAIADLTDDSRLVQPGWAFVARSGTCSDGRGYIDQAIQNGASAIITDIEPSTPLDNQPTVWIKFSAMDAKTVGRLAERFFGHPAQALKVIGITGTNGKTTIAYVIQHLLNQVGYQCGLISTIQIDDGHAQYPTTLTTPGAIDLSRVLATMVANGCQAVVMEVSSHALDQGRVEVIPFKVAIFTNLTGDHLDYHPTMDAYADSKAKLFESLDPSAWAVINADDPYASRMIRDCRSRVLRTRIRLSSQPLRRWPKWTEQVDSQAVLVDAPRQLDCLGTVLALSSVSTRARLDGPWGSVDVRLPLVGGHNVSNVLQAVVGANALTATEYGLHGALENIPPIPGRLERVGASGPAGTAADQGPVVFVDYAHTHDALENVLRAVQPLVAQRLILVFGCGGDRDRRKRPKMAAVACRWAHHVVITSDNPRTEEPQAIIDEVLAGVPHDAKARVTVEPDRAAAIDRAIREADDHDTVLIAGKGHEDYQIVGAEKSPFDDRVHATQALRKRVGA